MCWCQTYHQRVKTFNMLVSKSEDVCVLVSVAFREWRCLFWCQTRHQRVKVAHPTAGAVSGNNPIVMMTAATLTSCPGMLAWKTGNTALPTRHPYFLPQWHPTPLCPLLSWRTSQEGMSCLSHTQGDSVTDFSPVDCHCNISLHRHVPAPCCKLVIM